MAILSNPRTDLPLDADPTDLARVTRAANHDTSLASWAVSMMGVGLLIQVPTLAALATTSRVVLALLLLPLLGGGTRAILHLQRASAGISSATTMTQLLAGLETRQYWAYRAQSWAMATGLGFSLWTLVLQLLA
ncbi:hypothetical protein [Actinocorallia longicatena]|uniref:Uncharacterized protein n=1 Tax=Actinocorallia longicatena TaxID=111803 RepID=A0ABP6Q6G6_9ACTN